MRAAHLALTAGAVAAAGVAAVLALAPGTKPREPAPSPDAGANAAGPMTQRAPIAAEQCSPPQRRRRGRGVDAATRAALTGLIESEELLLELTAKLRLLRLDMDDGPLPGAAGRALFANRVDVMRAGRHRRRVNAAHLALWRAQVTAELRWLQARLYFVEGQFVDEARTRWRASLRLSGLARTAAGSLRSLTADAQTEWKRTDDGWLIVAWNEGAVEQSDAVSLRFQDATDEWLLDEHTRQRARDSMHEDWIRRVVRDPRSGPPHEYFSVHAWDRHPGVSVVDIDRDGWDDLYVLDRWGSNLLLHNQRGDGFVDIAAAVGLGTTSHCSSAVFADFDNDGDSDVVVGRTLERTAYFINEGGAFIDASDRLDAPLPYLVSSVSAADYNGDGLLDVYLSTYASQTFDSPAARVRFLDSADEAEYCARSVAGHEMLDRVGPPNVLLVNRGGGRFERAPESDAVAAWRHTYQATWADIDDDGDADLYLANDYAANHLFRNDGAAGFVDVTEGSGTADLGFGMGASFGDYDGDGRLDLYVSNMYSKAGRRITGAVPNLDPRFAAMARGNSLFRNLGGVFEKISGIEPPALLVENAGWSWGGQFVDIDNDGDLDLYALSGFYTPPAELAVPVDT